MLCGLILRLFVANDFFLHEWDEQFHALVAKNLIKHPLIPTLYDNPILPYDFKAWNMNHIWVHKQPIPLWTMAASMCLFGVNEIALRLPSILLSTIGIGLIFYIGKYFFSEKTGLLAAFFFSINGLIIEMAGGRFATDHIDIFFMFFIELAVFLTICFVKHKKPAYNVLIGVAIGFAILTKWLTALIVLPIWVLIIWQSGQFKFLEAVKYFAIMVLVCISVFLPWQIYIFKVFPIEASWESHYNMKHITEYLDDHKKPLYYFFNQIRINYGELIYLPLAWFTWEIFKNKRKNWWAIGIWIFIPLIFFTIVKTKMQAYILFIAPALFLITAEFWNVLSSAEKNGYKKWFYNFILFLLIALPIRYSIERIKPFDNSERKPKYVDNLKKLNERNISRGVLFNYPKPIEAMFYTDLTVYPNLPETKIILELQKKRVSDINER